MRLLPAVLATRCPLVYVFALTTACIGVAVNHRPAHASDGSDITIIREAQSRSYWGADPLWIDWTGEKGLFRQIRDAGYEFCLQLKVLDVTCTEQQDEAVHAAVLILRADRDLRAMENKTSLTFEERWVAEHPEITGDIRSYCWELYGDHGARDARLISSCLGNLPAFSPLVPLPTVD